MLVRMSWRTFRLALVLSLIPGAGCFAEPPSTGGSTSSGSSGAASTSSGAAESSSTSEDEEEESSSGSSSGLGSSSSGGERLDAAYLYFTDSTYDGNFAAAAMAEGEAVPIWVDIECRNSTGYAVAGCDDAIALVNLPMFALSEVVPEGPFEANGMAIAETSQDLVAGELIMTLEDAGITSGNGNQFWTGIGDRDCMGWMSNMGAQGTVGDAGMDGPTWLTAEELECNMTAPLLCACWTN